MNSNFILDDYQLNVVKKIKNKCILKGDVGSGKSRTALFYYFTKYGGIITKNRFKPINDNAPKLLIITTAKKRDSKEWIQECAPFLLTPYAVDSWENIKKYKDIANTFIIFDEHKVGGFGVWAKAYIKMSIEKSNFSILLTGTPGDTWMDYLAPFIANGFYKNKRCFLESHAVYSRYSRFVIARWTDEDILEEHKHDILIEMEYHSKTPKQINTILCAHDKKAMAVCLKYRISRDSHTPINSITEWLYAQRQICNENPDRIHNLMTLVNTHDKIVLFYNFNYELDIIVKALTDNHITFAQWNGHKHEPLPTSKKWVYIVHYTSGAEGWECPEADTTIFYSYNYSYKITTQAMGRIDRRNTKHKELYYYFLTSDAQIDKRIKQALDKKRNFNIRAYCEKSRKKHML